MAAGYLRFPAPAATLPAPSSASSSSPAAHSRIFFPLPASCCGLARLPIVSSCYHQENVRLKPTACFVPFAVPVLMGAKEAFAVQEISDLPALFSASNVQVMYALVAVQAIALIGAAVGGTLARQRKAELEKLNAQLRKINDYLKSKAMIETYAPGLVYAPVGRPVDDKALNNEKEMLRGLLKSGKRFLREKRPDLAYEEFKKALPVAQRIGDTNEEKKAARGLGASLQRQGKFDEAIKYHNMVLEISRRTGTTHGNAEAFGSIADCYCELGDLESAQKFYNQYIDTLVVDED